MKRLVAYIAALVVLAAGVFIYVQQRHEGSDPFAEASPVRPAARMPFTVTTSVPGLGKMALGTTTSVAVTAVSKHPIDRVDLYDGALLVASGTPGVTGAAVLSYPAVHHGARLLSARAVDARGNVAVSAPVRVFVSNPPQRGRIGVAVPVVKGETVADLAKRLDVEPSEVFENPSTKKRAVPQKVSSDHILQGRRTVFVSINARPEARPPTALRIVEPTVLSDVPQLTISGSECHLELGVANASGKTYTFLEGTTSGWVELGSGPKHELKSLNPGAHIYAVRPKGGSAAQQSAPANVMVPASCGQGVGWSGDARIIDGQLYLDKPTNSMVYLYLRVDNQPARRLPYSQDLGFPGLAVTDVSDQLPRLVGSKLDLQVWKGGEFPQQVAAGRLEVPAGTTIQDVVGEPNQLTLAFSDGTAGQKSMGHDDGTVDLTWLSESSRVGRVLWQVTAKNPGDRNLSLTPDGLLASGTSNSTAGVGERSTGTFSIDTAKIPGHEEVSGSQSTAPKSGGGGVVLATSPVAGGSLSAATYASKPPKVPAGVSIVLQGYVAPPGPGEPVFVRVLALPDQTGVTAASPVSRIVMPAVEQGTLDDPIELKLTKVAVDLGTAPNPALVSCARVSVPWDGEATPPWTPGFPSTQDLSAYAKYGPNVGFVQPFYPKSGTYCPGDWPPADDCDSIFCDFVDGLVSIGEAIVDFATDLYSLVAYAYNGIINTVVKVIAEGPLCQLIGAADKSAGDGCSTVVGAAARAAIGAVLASVGLPPSLPSLEALEAMADGELDVLAVELMKQSGVPCDSLAQDPAIVDAAASAAKAAGTNSAYVEAAGDPCRAMARYLIGEVKGQVKQAASDSVAQSTGLPSLLGTPNASMTPEPKGLTQPWRITITAEPVRKNVDISTMSCRMAAKQVGGPTVWPNDTTAQLLPDGSGHLRGVVEFMPRVSADELSNVTATLKVRPYVSSCTFQEKAIVSSVKPFLPR